MIDETDAHRRDEQTPSERVAATGAFAADDRSVSEVLGAILIFGLLILLLVLIQLNAVPAANQQVEFEHNQRVQGDMQELQESLLRTSANGREGAVSIESGVGYPTRLFLFNPPRASGTVEMTAQGAVDIQNVRATSSEVTDYLDGTTTRSFETQGIAYRVDYNEYRGAPTTIYENGVLYNNYTGNRSVVQDRGAIVSGREISLVTLQGSLSTSSDRSIALGITPISAPTRTVSVTNQAAGAPLTITVPTRLGPDAWRALLDEELVDNGGHITNIRRGTADRNTVVFTLEEGITYDLRLSAVGIGSGYERSTPPQYITTVSGNGTAVPEGGSHQMVAEVRDAYNNPVSNVTVNASVALGDGRVTVVGSNQTNEDGQVTLEYTADGINTPTDDVDVSVWIGDSETPPADAQRVAPFSLTVFDVDGSGQTTPPTQGGAGNPLNPGDSVIMLTPEIDAVSGNCGSAHNSGADCDVTLTLKNLLGEPVQITGVRSSSYFAAGDSPAEEFVIQAAANGNATDTLTVGTDFSSAFFDSGGTAVSEFETIPAGGQRDFRFTFFEPVNNPGPDGYTREGDLFVFEVRYETDDGDTTYITYIVSPSV